MDVSTVLCTCGILWRMVHKKKTTDTFDHASIKKVKDAIVGRWMGLGSRQIGALSDLHVLAWILDPFTTPMITPVSYTHLTLPTILLV